MRFGVALGGSVGVASAAFDGGLEEFVVELLHDGDAFVEHVEVEDGACVVGLPVVLAASGPVPGRVGVRAVQPDLGESGVRRL